VLLAGAAKIGLLVSQIERSDEASKFLGRRGRASHSSKFIDAASQSSSLFRRVSRSVCPREQRVWWRTGRHRKSRCAIAPTWRQRACSSTVRAGDS